MSLFFDPKSPDTQPRFERSITSPEYQEGFLLGYLCNMKNYNLKGLTGSRSQGVLISAASSKIEPGISPDFDEPFIRTGISNIAELHSKTLWLGNGRISDSSGRLFEAARTAGIELKLNISSPYSFSCTQYAEELITAWGFSAVKDPMHTTMYVYPLFIGIDLSGDTPVFRSNGGVVPIDKGNSADEIWGHISRRLNENNIKLSDDFRKGFFDGINY